MSNTFFSCQSDQLLSRICIKEFPELTLNGSLEERTAFVNMLTCSQVHFK